MSTSKRGYIRDRQGNIRPVNGDNIAEQLQDGESYVVPTMMRDSATVTHVRFVDSEGRPAGRKSRYVFDARLTDDVVRGRSACETNRKLYYQTPGNVTGSRSAMSELLSKPHIITGRDPDTGQFLIEDATTIDGDTLKQEAYDSYCDELASAWNARPKGMSRTLLNICEAVAAEIDVKRRWLGEQGRRVSFCSGVLPERHVTREVACEPSVVGSLWPLPA